MLKTVFIIIVLGLITVLIGDSITGLLGLVPSVIANITDIVETIFTILGFFYLSLADHTLVMLVFMTNLLCFVICTIIQNFRGGN